MPIISDASLLNTWEQAIHLTYIDRGLLLLSLLDPELSITDSAKLSIGERDSRLLLLREEIFGSRLINTVVCPSCRNKLEWESNTRDLFLKQPDYNINNDEFDFSENEFLVKFRLPNSEDIAGVLNYSEGVQEDYLIKQCILKAERSGKAIQPDKLPPGLLDKILERMEELDPQADISINLTCPECGNKWTSHFDISAYLWSEINYWAINLMQEVDILARAYGWTETEIINLSPVRRHIYIDLINS